MARETSLREYEYINENGVIVTDPSINTDYLPCGINSDITYDLINNSLNIQRCDLNFNVFEDLLKYTTFSHEFKETLRGIRYNFSTQQILTINKLKTYEDTLALTASITNDYGRNVNQVLLDSREGMIDQGYLKIFINRLELTHVSKLQIYLNNFTLSEKKDILSTVPMNINNLVLVGNEIDNDVLTTISPVLSSKHLLCLDLSGNNIKDDGAITFIRNINIFLNELNLSNNLIKDSDEIPKIPTIRTFFINLTDQRDEAEESNANSAFPPEMAYLPSIFETPEEYSDNGEVAAMGGGAAAEAYDDCV